jgi:hypothetical protein
MPFPVGRAAGRGAAEGVKGPGAGAAGACTAAAVAAVGGSPADDTVRPAAKVAIVSAAAAGQRRRSAASNPANRLRTRAQADDDVGTTKIDLSAPGSTLSVSARIGRN